MIRDDECRSRDPGGRLGRRAPSDEASRDAATGSTDGAAPNAAAVPPVESGADGSRRGSDAGPFPAVAALARRLGIDPDGLRPAGALDDAQPACPFAVARRPRQREALAWTRRHRDLGAAELSRELRRLARRWAATQSPSDRLR